MRTYTTKSEMDARMVATLGQVMESRAFRELAAAQMFGYGLQFVPERANASRSIRAGEASTKTSNGATSRSR